MASQFDDLLSGVVNKLKGLGIGTKSPEQQAREADPVLKAQFERRIPTYDEIRESRRLRGERRQPSPYTQDLRTPSNIQAQEGQGTVGPAEYYDFNTRTDYSYEAPEYSKTMNFGTGLLSGKGLGLAAPATSYSAPVSSSGGSTGRGMYGMGTTPKGPIDAAEINPVFSKSDMDAIIAAGGRPENYGVFTTTDPETGKEVIVDSYGRAHYVPPASQTRPTFETERGSLNLPGMFDYLFGSDGRGAIVDDGTALVTGVPYARNVEGTPISFIAEGIGGMLSDMAERANPGDVRDQTVRARRADNARDLAEEKIRIEQRMMQGAIAQGLTPREAQRQVKSQLGQRRVEEEQAIRKQQREEALDQAAAEGYTQEEADLEVQRLLNRFPAPEKEEEETKDSFMDLLVSPVYGSDVIEDAPVQYDEMGNIISPTEVINTSQARAFDPQSVRNVRNNNPGNIKINKANDWKGRVSNLSDKTFESFQTPEYGVRALNKVVDANIKATNTFDEFVNRYASEPKEKEYFKKNGKLMPHLQNYADALARSQGLTSSSSKFPKNIDKKAWLRAIIRHEGGQEALSYYTDDVLSQGIKLK